MDEFFKGWRRKAGLVTLAMALLLMAGWMRSAILMDVIIIACGKETHIAQSLEGELSWRWLVNIAPQQSSAEWHTLKDAPLYLRFSTATSLTTERQLKWCGFDFGTTAENDGSWGIVPYWSLVLPLTLLSAWLILVKARNEKRTQAPIDSRSKEGQ